VHFKIVLEDVLDLHIRPGGVGEKGNIGGGKGARMIPVIEPKRSSSTIFYSNVSYRPLGVELIINNIPKITTRWGGEGV
jgi:hypothetical protein